MSAFLLPSDMLLCCLFCSLVPLIVSISVFQPLWLVFAAAPNESYTYCVLLSHHSNDCALHVVLVACVGVVVAIAVVATERTSTIVATATSAIALGTRKIYQSRSLDNRHNCHHNDCLKGVGYCHIASAPSAILVCTLM